jgi:cyclophilin family peptidyl-prolyl cis-trans isomerase
METDAGTIELELFDADAPNTVANFVKLAKDGFYDGLAFQPRGLPRHGRNGRPWLPHRL